MDNETARAALQERLRTFTADEETLEGEHAGENMDLAGISQHPADMGSEVSELDRENALIESARAEREDIEAALARIEAGTYGRCVDCGKQIPDERLEARPEAARCIEDQEKHDAAAR